MLTQIVSYLTSECPFHSFHVTSVGFYGFPVFQAVHLLVLKAIYPTSLIFSYWNNCTRYCTIIVLELFIAARTAIVHVSFLLWYTETHTGIDTHTYACVYFKTDTLYLCFNISESNFGP